MIKYGLYNVGGSAAVDVKLAERGFGAEDFDVVGGQMQVGALPDRTCSLVPSVTYISDMFKKNNVTMC